jgi:hypothetical protein
MTNRLLLPFDRGLATDRMCRYPNLGGVQGGGRMKSGRRDVKSMPKSVPDPDYCRTRES